MRGKNELGMGTITNELDWLKMMEKEGHYEELITILKDKPIIIESYNIFYIVIKSDPFLHMDYFQENNEFLKRPIQEKYDMLYYW